MVQDGRGAGLLKTWLGSSGHVLKIIIVERLGESRRDFPSWFGPWNVSRRLWLSFSVPTIPAPAEMSVTPCKKTAWPKVMEASFLLGISHFL